MSKQVYIDCIKIPWVSKMIEEHRDAPFAPIRQTRYETPYLLLTWCLHESMSHSGADYWLERYRESFPEAR